jgi:hypothetical protein
LLATPIEQTYHSKTHDWTSSKWTVANELATRASQTVAQAKGTMIVSSTVLDSPGAPLATTTDPKL